MDDSLTIFRTGLLLASLGLLAACRPVPDDLPALPNVDTSELLPGVRRQVETALEDARARSNNAKKVGHAGTVLQAYKFFDAAERCYARARRLEPREALWADLHGVTLESLGQSRAALEAYRASLDAWPLPQTAVRLANLLYAAGEHEEARRVLTASISRDLKSSNAYKAFGMLHLKSGNRDAAVEMLEKALELSGGPDKDVYYALAGVYRDSGRDAEAQKYMRLYRVHEEQRPIVFDPHLNVVQQQKQDDKTLVRAAQRLHAAGDSSTALAYAEKALEIHPESLPALTAMMIIHTELRDFVAVDEWFERAVAVAPDDPAVFTNLALARMHENRLVEARAALEKVLAIDPYFARAHLELGRVFLRRDEIAAASEAFRRAYELSGEDRALLGLAKSLDEQQRYDELAGLLENSAEPLGEADRVELVLLQSRALNALGQREDARRVIRSTLSEVDSTARRKRLERHLADIGD